MSDKDSPKPVTVLLWMDLETTGLSIKQDYVLEAAWFFTDLNLRIISPVRQRLCTFEPEEPRLGGFFDPADEKHWLEMGYFASAESWEIVSTMHRKSGLIQAFVEANPRRILTEPVQLETLLNEDLADIEDWINEERGEPVETKFALAGDGVGHFDHDMLHEHLPMFFPAHPQSSDEMLYWYFDVSPMRRLMGEEALATTRRWAASDAALWSVLSIDRHIEFDAAGDASWEELVFIDEMTQGWRINLAALSAHRAMSDTLAALVDARIMRAVLEAGSRDITS